MYTRQEDREVEKICYDSNHIEDVLGEIKTNFQNYFTRFITLDAGRVLSDKDIKRLADKFGIKNVKTNEDINKSERLKMIIKEAIDNFEKDRSKYLDIFDEEVLEEYEDDPSYFKSTILKNNCPIIHSTIHNKNAKELDKYRREFRLSDPNELLTVVNNLYVFATEYYENYEKDRYDKISKYSDLEVSDLDTDDYTVYGVIGGGIKSHMLYKVYPSVFPNRSRDAIWALWYLTGKKTFGCEQDSEFLMIDIEKTITQQNYFYPYELFTFYAHQIYQLIDQSIDKDKVYIDDEYRYVIVDEFLSFVAKEHAEEINFFRKQIKEGINHYA